MLRLFKGIRRALIVAAAVCAPVFLAACTAKETPKSTEPATPSATPEATATAEPTPTAADISTASVDTSVLPDMPKNDYPYVYRETESKITTLNPHNYTSTTEGGYISLTMETLLDVVYFKEIGTWKFVPIHAVDFPETTDNKVWTFTLRDGLKFENGTPIDAHLYEETWKLLLDPKLLNNGSSTFTVSLPVVKAREYVEGKAEWSEVGLKAKDAKTLELTLDVPMPTIDVYAVLSDNSLGPVDVEMYKKLMNADKTSTTYGLDLDSYVGCGPYKIESMNKDQFMNLVRNENSILAHYKTADRIEYRVSTEINTTLQLFEKGEIDTSSASSTNYLKYKDDPRIRQGYGNTIWGFYVNTDPEKVKNKILLDNDFRKALSLATDRREIGEGIFYTYKPANYFISSVCLVGDILEGKGTSYRETPQGKSISSAPLTDVDTAKKFFDKAYAANGGKPVTIDMIYFDGQSVMKKVAETIKEQWETAFGADKFTLNLTAVDPTPAYNMYAEHNFDLGIGARSQSAINPWASMRVWTSGFAVDNEKYDSFYNEEFDTLFDRTTTGDLVTKPEDRIDALKRMEELLVDYVPFITLFQNDNAFLFASRVHLPADGYVPVFGFGMTQARFDKLP